MQILQGPIVLIIGLTYGILWGVICHYVPDQSEVYINRWLILRDPSKILYISGVFGDTSHSPGGNGKCSSGRRQ